MFPAVFISPIGLEAGAAHAATVPASHRRVARIVARNQGLRQRSLVSGSHRKCLVSASKWPEIMAGPGLRGGNSGSRRVGAGRLADDVRVVHERATPGRGNRTGRARPREGQNGGSERRLLGGIGILGGGADVGSTAAVALVILAVTKVRSGPIA